MKNLKKSLVAAGVLVTLTAVIALLASPSTRAQIAEKIKFGVASVLDGDTPSEPVPVTGSYISVSDAFHFLEPLAPKGGNSQKFDASLLNYLSVEICEVNGSECPVVKTFTAQGSGAAQLRIGSTSGDGSYYIVNWDTQKFNLARKTYRVRVILADLELGAIDLTPETYAKFGRTWPIKFLIEKDPAIRVRLLRFLGKSCSQIASALKIEFNLSAEDTALLLASDQEPCSAQEIDIALKGVFQDAVIPDTTKVSDEATRTALTSFDPATGRMTFSTETPLLKGLNIGDVMVSEPSTAAPYGYLRKVTSMGKERGQIILETVQAKLTEAISKGTLEASGELAPSGGPANTLSAAKAQQNEAFTISSLDEGQQFNFQKDIDVTIDLAGGDDEIGGTGTVHVTGSVYFNAGYNLGLGIESCFEVPPVCVDRVEAWMGVEQKSRLKVTGEFDGKLHKEQVIDRVPLDPIVFFIGPVPVVLVPVVNIVLGVDGEAHINFSFEAEAVSKIKVGAKWTDPDDNGNGWENLSEFSPLAKTFFSADITGTIRMEAFGKVDAKLLLYGVFGPGFNGSVGIGANAQTGSKPLWRVFGHVTSAVNVGADVGGFFDIGEVWSHPILNEYFDIKEADNVAPQCDFSTDTIQAEIGVPKTLGPRSGFEGHFECTDPEGESITYSAVSSNSGDGVNGAIPLRYAFQSSGLRTITVTARDASGGTRTFALSVDVHNSLPIVTISAGSSVPATVQFFVASEAYDPDTGIFLGCSRFNWLVTAPDTVTVLNGGGTCNAVVVFGQEGVRTVTVTATDQYGGVGSNSITVNVTPAPANRPPVIDSFSFTIRASTGPRNDDCLFGTFCHVPNGSFLWNGFSQRLADEYGPPLYMTVNANDPEGDPIHYEWRCETGTQLATVTHEGDNEYSCTPLYATNNGIPIPINVYAIVSDGIYRAENKTLIYTYHYRVRPN